MSTSGKTKNDALENSFTSADSAGAGIPLRRGPVTALTDRMPVYAEIKNTTELKQTSRQVRQGKLIKWMAQPIPAVPEECQLLFSLAALTSIRALISRLHTAMNPGQPRSHAAGTIFPRKPRGRHHPACPAFPRRDIPKSMQDCRESSPRLWYGAGNEVPAPGAPRQHERIADCPFAVHPGMPNFQPPSVR
jgi:hypothetical protein